MVRVSAGLEPYFFFFYFRSGHLGGFIEMKLVSFKNTLINKVKKLAAVIHVLTMALRLSVVYKNKKQGCPLFGASSFFYNNYPIKLSKYPPISPVTTITQGGSFQ
jgi:hypothetical protein